MTYVWLTEEQARLIARHALDDRPNEACGLLVGKNKHIQQIIPTPNISNDPCHRFNIAPSALAQHLSEIRSQGLSLLGFYHSHPEGEPIPSPTDIREATYPDAIHLIVGLKTGKPKLGAWEIDGNRVDSVMLHINDLPPTATNIQTQHQLSKAQKNAIIMTAIIALTIMLVLSITLLPPAPAIPTP